MTRAQLTDAAWTFIEPLLPIGRFGPYPGRLRQQFEAVIWRFRTGGQWREMPTESVPGRPCTTVSGGDGTPGSSRPCWRA
ncbi:transposase [Streptomyces exfoliatus]|uniref:transposase n=1 Tax=Streptomyces exfoliatus TaxID=1905 RepID=UPI003791244E